MMVWRQTRIRIFQYLSLLALIFLFSCSENEEAIKEPEPEPEPELVSLLSQIDLTGYTKDICGYQSNGKEYAIVTNGYTSKETGNVAIVDVTDPLNPILASTIPYSGVNPKVWDHYLYVAQGSNVDGSWSKIFDIADPLNPTVVGDFPGVHNIFIDDSGYLYLTGHFAHTGMDSSVQLNVSIYDLKVDPTKPVKVWEAPPASKPAHDISVIRNKLYVFNDWESRIEIFDVTDRSSPVFLGKFQFNVAARVHSGWVTEDDQYLFVCLEGGVTYEDVIILDISDPGSPSEAGRIHDLHNTVHNLYIIGKYAYTSFYGAGLRIYDVSQPKTPSLVYEYDTKGSSIDSTGNHNFIGAYGVYPFAASRNIYVSDIANGLFIFKSELE